MKKTLAAGALSGTSVTTGGISGEAALLFGSMLEMGISVAYVPLVSYTGGSSAYLPILFEIKHQTGPIWLSGGAGFSQAIVSLSGFTATSSNGTFSAMAGLGLTTGGKVGFDASAKVYYIFTSGGNTLAIVPLAGIHIGI